MGMTRALLVTQYYRPELVGSAPFCGDLAEWFSGKGWRMTVLTGLPHYPKAEIFPGYREGRRRREKIDGVHVERLGIWIPKQRSAFARIASDGWFFIQGVRTLVSGRIRRHELVFSLCPSILAVLLGRLATRRGGHHVAIVHDIQSGLAQSLNMVKTAWMVRIMERAEIYALNHTDLVIVLTAEMKEHLRQVGITTPIDVIPIWADTKDVHPVTDASKAPTRIVYSGSFGRKQKVDQIVRLAANLQECDSPMEILLRGQGQEFEKLQADISARGLRNVRFADLLSTAEFSKSFADNDIHLVVQDSAAGQFAIPSKIYNIMAAGLPCVAPAPPNSALGHLQQKSKAFLCTPPDDSDSLSATVLRLSEDTELRRTLRKEGRQYIEQHCRKELVLDQIFSTALRLFHREKKKAAAILVFEPVAEGHPYEWIRHLIHCAEKDRPKQVIWLVVAPELYGELAAELRGFASDWIRLLTLSRSETALCRHRWLLLNSFARWWVARRYANRTGAGAVHFLSLDLLSVPLALGLGIGGRRVSGILFRPSVHYCYLGPYDPSWRERLRDLRKAMIYPRMLANRSLTSALTIDPYFAPYAVRFYRNGRKVKPLPDPVQSVDPISTLALDFPARSQLQRILFLMFGYLSERKGTLTLLEALRLLPPDISARAKIIFAGRIDPSIKAEVERGFLALQEEQAGLSFSLDNRWLGTEEIETLVRQADVVLAPYQRFVGSSGVMLWAARFGKPLLTQDFGILGPLVRDYRLGMTVDCTQPPAIADGLERFVRQGPTSFVDHRLAQKFIAAHSPRDFARSVLTSFATPSATQTGRV